jgi:guanylate kinase
MAGILFIISAPSGSGKSTLVGEVRRLVSGLDFSISYTTREPRGSEEDGREYHFTTRTKFTAMVEHGEFLEWAEVFGNFYGTAVEALDHAREQGRDLLLDIDVQGALQVMEKMPEAVSIFILPPSPEVLERRLRNRSQAEGMSNEAVIEKRLAEARTELEHLEEYR